MILSWMIINRIMVLKLVFQFKNQKTPQHLNNIQTMKRENNKFNDAPVTNRVIGNFSGGLASAISCYYALEEFDNIHLAFTDTRIEHPDTYKFIKQFEVLTGEKVHVYAHDVFKSPEEVMRHYRGLNFAHGAPCSMTLKQQVAKTQIRNKHTDYGEVFGFDINEINRANKRQINNPDINCIYPLIERSLSKNDLFDIANDLGMMIPSPYKKFLNNNCIGADDSPVGGCVQGGIGYWQKIKEVFPLKYERMASLEHEITDLRYKKMECDGKLTDFTVATICKNQAKGFKGERLFLKPNQKFPEVRTIDIKKGRQPITVFECGLNCSVDLFDTFDLN